MIGGKLHAFTVERNTPRTSSRAGKLHARQLFRCSSSWRARRAATTTTIVRCGESNDTEHVSHIALTSSGEETQSPRVYTASSPLPDSAVWLNVGRVRAAIRSQGTIDANNTASKIVPPEKDAPC